MRTITSAQFVSSVNKIWSRSPAQYKSGKSGDFVNGICLCDCIGLGIGAIRDAGSQWTGTHGSNYSFRYEMQSTFQIKSTSQLKIGMCVYKARQPGQAYYNLPSRYAKHPDQRDYYHIGYVVSTNPLRIKHCTTPGDFVQDTKLGKWKFAGYFKCVQPVSINTANKPLNNTVSTWYVVGEGKLNMRYGPSSKYKRIQYLDPGDKVSIITDRPTKQGWVYVLANGKKGYVMSKFISTTPA